MAEFRFPNITATTTEGQLTQIKTYLYQLTNQLNFALKNVGKMEGNQAGVSSGSTEDTQLQKIYQILKLMEKKNEEQEL